jgi:hypothetical protein
MATNKSVIGIVASVERAQLIVAELQRTGFSSTDISALLPDRRSSRDFAHENNTKAPEGAIAGVGAGGAIGGTLGLLAGVGALAIPGVGPFIAAGPIMAALSGAAAGAAVGGIAGALIGLGVPEIEARKYEGRVKGGSILLSVHVENGEERDRAKRIFEAAGAEDIVTVGEQKAPEKPRTQQAGRY